MIIDNETNYLYLADSLNKPEFVPFLKRFTKQLETNNVQFSFLKDTKDIWAVDYMPVQIDVNEFVKFVYNPDYLRNSKSFKNTISDTNKICKSLGIKPQRSAIVLDGGNLIHAKNRAIISKKVFKENPNIPELELTLLLKDALKVEQIIFIPWQKSDFTGHADGMVRFIDDNTVLINDYKNEDTFKLELVETLQAAGLKTIKLPYHPYENTSNDHAYGVYINYLQINNLIFLPIYGGEFSRFDKEAILLMEAFFKNVIPIESNEIAKYGGILNCITWNIKVEKKQYCPICNKEVVPNERYSNYICDDCSLKTTDVNGRPVCFSNTDIMGYGCQGYYNDGNTEEYYKSNTCFVNGILCIAEEARFGGIVIQCRK